ncbi:hypothetical protein BD626DRAFT_478748 [Schizophyllum amplum]|uniref:Uncharacterized protein n=1 Tax=Schizophyllum amplum TaxID=97359 RepID=A0A550CRJ2_9AGAR|nr:hypothetical protein BD626DRAFT_478748 [Auriculariopsis ampla]
MPKVTSRTCEPDVVKQPKVIARKFIGKSIVMLHCESSLDCQQIRLQYRDGTPLPRPNVVGFELIDRVTRRPASWHGFGTPLVYRSWINKRGSYALRYKGREVWTYMSDEWAEFHRFNEEEAKKPYDMDKWNRIMEHLANSARNPKPFNEDNVLMKQGDLTVADVQEDYPEDLFTRCDLEPTHQLRQYKKRTGTYLRLPA